MPVWLGIIISVAAAILIQRWGSTVIDACLTILQRRQDRAAQRAGFHCANCMEDPGFHHNDPLHWSRERMQP